MGTPWAGYLVCELTGWGGPQRRQPPSQSRTGCDGTPCALSLAVFDEYLKISGKPIEYSIRAELSGDFEKLMLAVGKRALDGEPGRAG